MEKSYRLISLGPPTCRIETDSSFIGYGGHDITLMESGQKLRKNII